MKYKMQLLPILFALFILVTVIPLGMAASVTPEKVDPWTSGDAASECEQAGYNCEFSYKIDNWDSIDENSIYTANGNTITILNSNGKTFDWKSEYPVCAVIVKAGTAAYIYKYNGEYSSDTGLVGPDGKDISHVTFCFNVPDLVENLKVSKTADTSYTRTHKWDITKSVDTVNDYMHNGFPKIWLYTDGHGDETATWIVDVKYNGYEDSDYAVSGTITIENTGDLDATITNIEDVLSGNSFTVELPGGVTSYTLPAGQTLTLAYNMPVNSKINGYNDAKVTTERGNYEGRSAEIFWGDPTTEVNKEITVRDSMYLDDVLLNVQDLGTVTASNDQQFTYTKDFAWADYGKDKGGDYTYHNTATIVETGQSDDATLLVNVQKYMYETAYAKGSEAKCFIPTFANWGWTNPIKPGTYTMDLWAGAAQCDTTKGTQVGTVIVVYGIDGYVTVTYNMNKGFLLEETHVYAGSEIFPKDKKGKFTVAPGAYSNASPFNGDPVYVIAHAVVGIPDPNFGPK